VSIRLSVLDQSPIGEEQSREEALCATVRLAVVLDNCGFTRFWLAEHHDAVDFAGSAPEILIATILERTTTLRVGSGGVLLPLYPVKKVVEVFQILDALHPDRVDLGVGRAGGPDEGYVEKLQTLATVMEATQLNGGTTRPSIWLLGTSDSSSTVAATLGMGYAFGHFLNAGPAVRALKNYQKSFVPTSNRPLQESALAVRVVVAETSEEASMLADTVLLWRVRKDLGQTLSFPTAIAARAHDWSESELVRRRVRNRNIVHGDPDSVKRDLESLAALNHVDEIIVNTPLSNISDRITSYRLLADAFGLRLDGARDSSAEVNDEGARPKVAS
jgi:alkanesulfonate monooxygenase SsuD/methylene tetrahydromethanopterin reductase-like flavin-dependent oxidoreductase (luciferase family)